MSRMRLIVVGAALAASLAACGSAVPAGGPNSPAVPTAPAASAPAGSAPAGSAPAASSAASAPAASGPAASSAAPSPAAPSAPAAPTSAPVTAGSTAASTPAVLPPPSNAPSSGGTSTGTTADSPTSRPTSTGRPVVSTTPAPPTPPGEQLTLTGTVEAGVERGCLILKDTATGRQVNLTSGDKNIVKVGAKVTVVGVIRKDMMSYCQQGAIFQVVRATAG
ncbi:hypothetical protein ABIB25_002713 [Nakamurella sp. UYEF19]|uniref:hypothetical protein n=1 Tax=Nakamurella sp. UYEF19 TaxID=1756392 RepID=UPI00339B6F18